MAARRPGLTRRRFLLATAAGGMLAPAAAQAGSISVNPIFLELAPGRRTATIDIANRGGATAAVQLRAFAWTQQGDEDRLEPTQDLLASPPIFEVAAGDDYLARVMIRRPAGSADRTYRLLLDEIPPVGRNRQIVVALRVSMPVIVLGTAPAKPILEWQAIAERGNQLILSARNTGQRHVRVHSLEVSLPGAGAPRVAEPVAANPYVLPGITRRWRVRLTRALAAGGTVRLSAQTTAGHSEHMAPIIF